MRILVSSCLLGEDTRYDGLNSSIALNPKFRFAQKELFMDIMCENEIFSICPEVAGGLGIPRNKSFGRRLSPAYHQKAAFALDYPRAAVVFAGQHQYRLPESQRRVDLGRMGR